jgi:signal peptidase I
MKKPWIAAVLSLFCTGLGHLYCGRLGRGIALFLVPLALLLLLIGIVTLPPSMPLLLLLIVLVLLGPIVYLYAALDAHRLARGLAAGAPPRPWQHPLVYAVLLVVGFLYPLLAVAFLKAEALEAFRIPQASMAPTILPGDRLLVRKWGWRPEDARVGDVVVFRSPEAGGPHYIKRVAGLPGDRIEDQRVVPAGHVWVLGDNAENSRDSRAFGPVPVTSLLGPVIYRYWPPTRIGPLR